MPPKPKKKTPKQLLAEAELLVLALRQELQSTKKDYGEILSRMATANSELKGVVLKQELQLASSFDARELKLRLDLSQARLEVRDLKEIEKAGREARAAIETHEAERLHLQRQLAEAVGAREVMERAHATELLVYKQSVTKVTVGLEQKFKEQVGMMRESIRRDLAKEMGGDAMEAITQVIGLKALAARHARELAAAQLLLEEKEGENVRLRRSLVRLERMLLESEKTGVMEKESLRMAVETMRVKLGRAVALGASVGAGGGGGGEGPPLSPSSPSPMSSFASPTRPTSSSSYLPSALDTPLERELQQQHHQQQQQQHPRSSPILSSPSTTSAYHTYRSPQAGSAEGGVDSRGGSNGDRQQRLDEKEEEEEDFSDIPPPPPPPPSQRPVRPHSAAPPSSLLSPPPTPFSPPALAEGVLPPLPLASLPSYDEGSNSSSGSSSSSSSNSGGVGAGDQRGERSPSGGVMSSPGGKSVTFAVQRPSSRGGVATTTTNNNNSNNAPLESTLGAASLPASTAPASSPIATSSNFSSPSAAAAAASAAGAAVYPLPSPSRLGNRPGSPSNSYRPMSNTLSTPTAATSFTSKRAAGSSSSSSSSFLPSSPSPSSPRSPFTVANAAALLTEAAYRAGFKMAAAGVEGGGGGGASASPAKLNHFKTMEWGAT